MSKKLDAGKFGSSKLGIGCGALFLLPFLAVGVVMAGLTAWSVYDYQRMQTWVEVPAQLTDLEQTRGEDSTGVKATYTYEYQGQTYTGQRVALHSGSDNIGGFQGRMYRRLKQARDNVRPVPCFVNPEQPGEATLNRELRPEMLVFKGMFGVLFGGVGLGGYGLLWYVARRQRAREAAAREAPDQPWRWREDWRRGVVRSNSGSGLLFLLAFATFWNLVSWTVAGAFWLDDEQHEWFVTPLVSLFPLVGVGLLIGLAVAYVRWRQFRGATFRMAKVPGVVGGKLSGVVVVPQSIQPEDGFRLHLKNTRTVRRGKHTREEVLWEDQRLVGRTLDSHQPGETNVPVAFTIPSSADQTDTDRDIRWKLVCQATLPGPDLSVEFDVPVYRTAESRDDVTADQSDPVLAEFEKAEPLEATLARDGIHMGRGHHPDEVVFRTPPGRHWGACLFLLLFSTVWSGICVGLWWNELWLFAVVFTFFALLVVPVTVNLCLSTRVLTVNGNRWEVRSGWWPVLWKRVAFYGEDIQRIDKESNFSSNGHKWYRLRAKLRGKKKPVVLSHQLTDRRVERLWLEDLRRRAGLDAEPSEGADDSLVLEARLDAWADPAR